MYRKQQAQRTSIAVNKQYLGETIEKKIRRIENNKEPITDGAPLIYTERKNGIMPEYNIKTDRWEIAVDAMDKVTAGKLAKRMSIGEQALQGMKKESEGTSANTSDNPNKG